MSGLVQLDLSLRVLIRRGVLPRGRRAEGRVEQRVGSLEATRGEGDGAGVLIDQALLVLALAVPGVEQVIQRLQLAT